MAIAIPDFMLSPMSIFRDFPYQCRRFMSVFDAYIPAYSKVSFKSSCKDNKLQCFLKTYIVRYIALLEVNSSDFLKHVL